jgi:hypothetical protein
MGVKFNLKVRSCMEEPLVAQWFISIQSAAAEFDVPSRDREVSRVCDVPSSTLD